MQQNHKETQLFKTEDATVSDGQEDNSNGEETNPEVQDSYGPI